MFYINIKTRITKVRSLFSMVFLVMIGMLIFSNPLIAQDEEIGIEKPEEDKPVRSIFESALLIDNQTVVVPNKGTFEFDILHRFGTLDKGIEDLFGLYANSNIRLGFGYAPIDNLFLGAGLTKFKNIVDLSAKYALLKQTRSGAIPVFVTYYGNMAFDTRKEDKREEVYHSSDRISYFHQIIIGRKFNKWLSVQVAPSVSHYNIVEENKNHDHIAVALGTQLKLTESMDFILNIDQPITKHSSANPNPNVSFGIQMATSSHAFQIFLGNSNKIIPQETNYYNNNNYSDKFTENFIIGFNITRLWAL